MITHFSHNYLHRDELDAFLCSRQLTDVASVSSAILVQVFSATTEPAHFLRIAELIQAKLPAAVIAGATTVGEIIAGKLLTGCTVIGITCFTSSSVTAIDMPCDEVSAHQVGAELGRQIAQCAGPVAAVLLLATTLSIDAAALLQGIETTARGYPVLGGGAGDYAAMSNSLVFSGTRHYSKGAVALVLAGDHLNVDFKTHLGWRPLSRPMQVTEVDYLLVKTVDNRPAFEVYQHYLNIQDDENFFLNALEFPFLLERDGESLARVPVAVTADGALQFVADIREGEAFRLGYGDIDLIVEDAAAIHRDMTQFAPQAIFLYTCGCRRFLMQNDVDLETGPFEAIARTFGFYTYGEFFPGPSLSLLNSTMVAVGLREGEAKAAQLPKPLPEVNIPAPVMDPYASKHSRIVSRLMRFIDTVTSELEDSNREITKLSLTDRLTQLANRTHLERVLHDNLQRALRYATPFAVIMVDLDHFKLVNDTHGHMVGDNVLVAIANLLSSHTRTIDTVGRWGGEEFLVIIPNTTLDDAVLAAEKLRAAIGAHTFPAAGRQTGSFGVTAYLAGDTADALVNRADGALYDAKHAGRDRVEKGPSNRTSRFCD